MMDADRWLDDVVTLRALLRVVLETRKAWDDASANEREHTKAHYQLLRERMLEAEEMGRQFLSMTG